MTEKKEHSFVLTGLVLLLGLVALLGWLQTIELRGEEPRRAVVTLEMLYSGNYLVPQLNGWTYYNKPPLFNWLQLPFVQLFQSKAEWVMRLPSLLACLLIGFLHYRWAGKALGKEVGLWAALFYVLGAEILLYGSVVAGEIDLFYSLLVYVQWMLIYHFFKEERYWPLFLGSYVLVAAGFLTKGLPSLPFQAFTLLALFIWKRKFRILFGIQHIVGILLFAVLVGSYFWCYDQSEDAWAYLVRQYKEAAQRTGFENRFGQVVATFFSTPLELLKLLLPWSVFVLFLFSKSIRRAIRESFFLQFCLLVIAVNFPLYWLSGDFKPRYVYMFFPFCTAILAFAAWKANVLQLRLFKQVLWGLGGVFSLLPLAIWSLLWVPDLQFLPVLPLKIGLISLLSFGATFLFWRSHRPMMALFLCMIIFRIGMNLFYLPALQRSDSLPYREETSRILERTGSEQIFVLGQAIRQRSDASLGPFTFSEVEVTIPMVMAYQIPYYLSRANGFVLEFVEVPMPGGWHLVLADSVWGREKEVYGRISDRAIERDWLLVRF